MSRACDRDLRRVAPPARSRAPRSSASSGSRTVVLTAPARFSRRATCLRRRITRLAHAGAAGPAARLWLASAHRPPRIDPPAPVVLGSLLVVWFTDALGQQLQFPTGRKGAAVPRPLSGSGGTTGSASTRSEDLRLLVGSAREPGKSTPVRSVAGADRPAPAAALDDQLHPAFTGSALNRDAARVRGRACYQVLFRARP